MKKKWINLMAIVLTVVLIATACQSNASKNQQSLMFATGTTTGVFYSLGALLSTMWSNELGQRVVSSASNGSVENLFLMKKGEANIGFTTVNMAYEAYNGEGLFSESKYDDVRLLANLYPNVNHIIALDNGEINSVEDLTGNSFVFGAAGSATELESKLVLEAHGVPIDQVKANYVGFTEAVDLMRNGQVDAVNIYSGVPSSATTELISTFDSKVLNLSEGAIEKLTSDYAWNFQYVIEPNTYDKQAEPIVTVAQYSSIVVDANLSDETVYELTKIIWDNLDELENGHSIAGQFNPANAVEGTAGIPLHPGAERYYKEIGVLN